LSPDSNGVGDRLLVGVPPLNVTNNYVNPYLTMTTHTWILPGSLNQEPALIGCGKGGNVTSPLLHCVVPYATWVPVAVTLAATAIPGYFTF